MNFLSIVSVISQGLSHPQLDSKFFLSQGFLSGFKIQGFNGTDNIRGYFAFFSVRAKLAIKPISVDSYIYDIELM